MKTILIVEDDFYIGQMYNQAFTDAGYKVDLVSTGPDLVTKMNSGKYDAILLDVMLPKISGVELLKTIRTTDNPNSKSVIFIMTNNDDSQVQKEVFEAGADRFFIKANYTPKQIVQGIEDVIASKLRHEEKKTT